MPKSAKKGKECYVCGAVYTPKRADQYYCDPKCRKKHWRSGMTAEEKITCDIIETNIASILRTNKIAAEDALRRSMKSRGLDILDRQNLKLEFISTNIPELDQLLALKSDGEYRMEEDKYVGGFPRSAITEVYGRKGAGKTNILLRILSRQDVSILYFDTEGAIKESPTELPIPENVTLIRTNSLETIWGLVNDAVEDNQYDVIVVDGIAGLSTSKEIADDNDPGGFQDRAKKLSAFLRTLEHYLCSSRTAVIFTNQQKESMDPFKPKQTMGGTAVAYYCSVRLELLSNSSDKIMKDGVKVGHKIRVKLEKNRFGPDGQETTFKLLFKELS